MDDEPGIGTLFIGAAVAVALLAVVTMGVLSINRAAAPYAEETRYQTRQESQSYIDGTLADFEELCLKLATAQPGQESIYADVIFRRSGRVGDSALDELTPELRSCIRTARDIVRAGAR